MVRPDFHRVECGLRRLLARDQLQSWSGPLSHLKPDPDDRVLVLSDAGQGDRDQILAQTWATAARRIKPVLLAPCPARWWTIEILTHFRVVPWDRGQSLRVATHLPGSTPRPQFGVDDLLALSAAVIVLDATLIRNLRMVMIDHGYQIEVSAELALSCHGAVEICSPEAITLRTSWEPSLRTGLQQWQKTDPVLVQAMADLVQDLQGGTLAGILAAVRQALILGDPITTELRQQLLAAIKTLQQGSLTAWDGLILSALDRIQPADWELCPEFAALFALGPALRGATAPPRYRSELAVPFLPRNSPLSGYLWQVGNTWQVLTGDETPVQRTASRLTQIRAANGTLPYQNGSVSGILRPRRDGFTPLTYPVELQVATGKLTIAPITRPPWTTAMGRDRYGLWASFKIQGVVFRLRWIPPGTFLMGSPADEPGRFDDEGPQHRVTLTKGFWLAETPCTQAQWLAVMGTNPSKYQTPERPVEQVSWDDCQQFCQTLNNLVPDLGGRLPSEAEWEYACRAGTTTALYTGPIEILGERNAPGLDPIAWYGGNSGVEGESGIIGENFSDWKEKQYEHGQAATHLVGLKLPNPWGLYDLLGNVWEWCQDRFGDYQTDDQVNPTGADNGVGRVVRGGSWLNHARGCRSANRYWILPEGRDWDLGFRLSAGQSQGPNPSYFDKMRIYPWILVLLNGDDSEIKPPTYEKLQSIIRRRLVFFLKDKWGLCSSLQIMGRTEDADPSTISNWLVNSWQTNGHFFENTLESLNRMFGIPIDEIGKLFNQLLPLNTVLHQGIFAEPNEMFLVEIITSAWLGKPCRFRRKSKQGEDKIFGDGMILLNNNLSFPIDILPVLEHELGIQPKGELNQRRQEITNIIKSERIVGKPLYLLVQNLSWNQIRTTCEGFGPQVLAVFEKGHPDPLRSHEALSKIIHAINR